MKIHHALAPREDTARPIVLAIGFFDGFHCGHRAIIDALLRERRPGYRAAVLTFRNHPATFLRPESVPQMISTLEERIDHLGAAGIDECYLVPFDAAIASIEAARFIDEFVIGQLRARALVVGENFRFGARRMGDVHVARERAAAHDVRFVAVSPREDSGERISSTRIRHAIAAGDLALADSLLDSGYEIRGRVAVGLGRGHDLGFPTANLEHIGHKALPRDGVYAAVARYDGTDYAALVSIGTNPTFDGEKRTIEAWLRDFSDSIYGREIALRGFRFVRDQQRFDGVDALLQQMRADLAAVPYPTFALAKETLT